EPLAHVVDVELVEVSQEPIAIGADSLEGDHLDFLAGFLAALLGVGVFAALGGNSAAAAKARAIHPASARGSRIIRSGSITLSLRARPSPIGSNGAAPGSASASARSSSGSQIMVESPNRPAKIWGRSPWPPRRR